MSYHPHLPLNEETHVDVVCDYKCESMMANMIEYKECRTRTLRTMHVTFKEFTTHATNVSLDVPHFRSLSIASLFTRRHTSLERHKLTNFCR